MIWLMIPGLGLAFASVFVAFRLVRFGEPITALNFFLAWGIASAAAAILALRDRKREVGLARAREELDHRPPVGDPLAATIQADRDFAFRESVVFGIDCHFECLWMLNDSTWGSRISILCLRSAKRDPNQLRKDIVYFASKVHGRKQNLLAIVHGEVFAKDLVHLRMLPWAFTVDERRRTVQACRVDWHPIVGDMLYKKIGQFFEEAGFAVEWTTKPNVYFEISKRGSLLGLLSWLLEWLSTRRRNSRA